jgi:hypothetical protein
MVDLSSLTKLNVKVISTSSATLSASSANNYLELIEFANNCSFNTPRYWTDLHDIF